VLREDLGALLSSGLGADLTLVVEGSELYVHKAILAARCACFRESFDTLPARLVIEDASLACFRAFLGYVYTAQLDIRQGQPLAVILEYSSLGVRYGVESLVRRVSAELSSLLDSGTLVPFLAELKTSQVPVSQDVKTACATHFFKDIK
jgi:BTB/POZ domain